MAGVFRHRFRLPGRPNPLGILTASAAGGGQTLTPSLFTNSNTFYAPTVSGTYTLSPGLYTDSDTFYSPTVSTSYSITPGLYTDPDTFYSPAVSATYTLTPGLYDDGDTFYTHVVSLGGSQTLVPGLYVDSDTFYSPTVSSTYTLTPALYADPDTFYSATISSTYVIAPTLYVDPDTFYAATVGSFGGPQTLLPSLYVDPDTFYVHTITGGLGSGVGQRTRYITVEFYDGGDVWRTNIARDILEHSTQPSKIAFSYVSPQDSIACASGTDKIHYTRGQVMGSIQRRSAFKKVFVAPPPPPPNPILWSSDGSSLVGWTVVGATVDASLGDPLPSFKATGAQYAYIAPISGLVGKSIQVRVRVIPGTTELCNLFFGCNASGAGRMLRLEARAGQHSGIATTTSWTAWDVPAATGVVVPAGQWMSIRIDIKTGPVADWYLDDVLKQSNVSIAVNGDYIAVHGDGGGVTGGNFDNLQIATTSLL